MDQRLSWYPEIEAIDNSIRKLIWILKNAAKLLLTKLYIALVQSILGYCIPIWCGAPKSKFITIERAQRLLIKVMYFKNFSFATEKLYSISQLLTSRKPYVLQTKFRFDTNNIVRRKRTKLADLLKPVPKSVYTHL